MSDDYSDIINLPHHISRRRPRMSVYMRAAQFAPFAALTGHGEMIAETARLTDSFDELCEDSANMLSQKLMLLTEKISDKPYITVLRFIPDKTKDGGEFSKISGNVRRIDEVNRILIFIDGTEISFDSIADMSGDVFGDIVE